MDPVASDEVIRILTNEIMIRKEEREVAQRGLDEAQTQIATLTELNVTLNKDLRSLRRSSKKAEAALVKEQKKNGDLSNNMDETTSALGDAQEQIASLNNDLETHKQRSLKRKRRIAVLKTANEDLEAQHTVLQKQVADLEAQRVVLQKRATEYKGQRQVIEGSTMRVISKLKEDLSNALESCHQKNQDILTSKATALSLVNDLREAKEEMQKMRADKEDKVKKANEEVASNRPAQVLAKRKAESMPACPTASKKRALDVINVPDSPCPKVEEDELTDGLNSEYACPDSIEEVMKKLPRLNNYPANELTPLSCRSQKGLNVKVRELPENISVKRWLQIMDDEVMWYEPCPHHGYVLRWADADAKMIVHLDPHVTTNAESALDISSPFEAFLQREGQWFYLGTYHLLYLPCLPVGSFEHLPATTRALLIDQVVEEEEADRNHVEDQFLSGSQLVGCFGLQCVGFDTAFHAALQIKSEPALKRKRRKTESDADRQKEESA